MEYIYRFPTWIYKQMVQKSNSFNLMVKNDDNTRWLTKYRPCMKSFILLSRYEYTLHIKQCLHLFRNVGRHVTVVLSVLPSREISTQKTQHQQFVRCTWKHFFLVIILGYSICDSINDINGAIMTFKWHPFAPEKLTSFRQKYE